MIVCTHLSLLRGHFLDAQRTPVSIGVPARGWIVVGSGVMWFAPAPGGISINMIGRVEGFHHQIANRRQIWDSGPAEVQQLFSRIPGCCGIGGRGSCRVEGRGEVGVF